MLKHIRNIIYGILEIIDGIILIITLGSVHTVLCFKFLTLWGKVIKEKKENVMKHSIECTDLLSVADQNPHVIQEFLAKSDLFHKNTNFEFFHYLVTKVYVFSTDDNFYIVFNNIDLDYNTIKNDYLVSAKYYTGEGKINRGFQSCLDYVWKDLFSYIGKHCYNKKLIVTGYSYGGALATICAYRLSKLFIHNKLELYTFGSPKVGNKMWAFNFNVDTYRFVDVMDALPNVLSSFKYKHIGTELFLDYNGDCTINPSIWKKLKTKLTTKHRYEEKENVIMYYFYKVHHNRGLLHSSR